MGQRMAASCPPLLPFVLAGLALLVPAVPAEAGQPYRPAAPAPPIQHFDSDPQACRPEAIRASYEAHLLPYADQPPAVLARLRRLQDDLTLASLKRCVQKGLLTRPQASELFRGLGLTLPGTPIQPASANPLPAAAPAGDAQPSTPAGTVQPSTPASTRP